MCGGGGWQGKNMYVVSVLHSGGCGQEQQCLLCKSWIVSMLYC